MTTTSSIPSVASQTTKFDTQVPYNSSVTIVAVIAFVSPLASFLWSFHRSIHPDNEYYDPHHRYLKEIECGNSTAAAAGGAEAEGGESESTWSAIQTTSIISATVGCLCLLGYELFRRDPIIGKYVYDRKRLSQPKRTPPPLMLSRSLWCGDDDDGTKNNRFCCKVPPAILEFLFLILDSNYIAYSHTAYEASKEREKEGNVTFCRKGRYHNNCCNNHGLTAEDGGFVDEDGYVFYPGYCNHLSHECISKRSSKYSPRKKLQRSMSLPLGDSTRGDPEDEIIDEAPSPQWRNTINDLYPEDDPRNFFAAMRTESTHRLLVDDDLYAGGDGDDEQHFMSPKGSEGVSAFAGDDENLSSGRSNVSFQSANSFEGSFRVEKIEGELEGKLNSPSGNAGPDVEPGGILEGESKCPLDESSIISSEVQESGEESEGKLETKSGYVEPDGEMEGERNGSEVKSGMSKMISQRSALLDRPTYPRRIKYIFLPPGFHDWGHVIDYIGYLFILPSVANWFRKHIAKIPRSSPTNRYDNIHRRGRPSVPMEDPGKDLTEGEQELLRCAGLDNYLLIRLARFGFDVTYYPFVVACVAVLPIYYTCEPDPNRPDDARYLSLTINRIPDESGKILWILVFTMVLYIYMMRRLWLEWEVFIKLRHNFLATGDPSFHTSATYLKKYRNTCMVECVPKSHRSDSRLKDMFEELYPGQIDHAEMLIDTSNLEKMVYGRQKMIEKYDNVDSRYRYECWKYNNRVREGNLVDCCNKPVPEPQKPMVHNRLCSGEKHDALENYGSKINKADLSVDVAYADLVAKRKKLCEESHGREQENGVNINSLGKNATQNLYSLFVPSMVRKYFGEETEFFYATGMVTFNSIAVKQSAVQCNLTGQPNWMITVDAPDPRDIFWGNIGVERENRENRKILVEFLLLLGILGWGTIATLIQAWTVNIWNSASSSDDNSGPLDSLIRGYLPAYVVSLILLWLPNLFFLLAMRVIRFNSHTRCDEFVLLWNTGYRLANVFFTFFSMSLFTALRCLKENPEDFVLYLADGIIQQSAFLMNLMILATGQETMLQLLQWRSILKQAVLRPLVNLNKKSRRYHDWLDAPPEFEKSFLFGFFAPVLSYGLMIAMVFSFMAPLMLGVCSIFFWVASKVHTHNALFVYTQRCEGGGKIFYYWNRIVFITLYSSIVIFSGILALKKRYKMGPSFLLVMTLVTYCVDKSVENTFVIHSLHLPISVARIHEEEEVALLADKNVKPDGGENFMYRHPLLNQDNWNSYKPNWR